MATNFSTDPLTTTAEQLRVHLTNGAIRSTELIDIYLTQIEKHNHRGLGLHAVISTACSEKLFEYAKRLDEERSAGRLEDLCMAFQSSSRTTS